MATMNDGELLVSIDGADEDGLRRALLAARKILAESGISMEDAFRGHWEAEGASLKGTRLREDHARGAERLGQARDAAARACFADRPDAFADLALYDVWLESEKSIDERGLRHLNPDQGPHYSLAPERVLH